MQHHHRDHDLIAQLAHELRGPIAAVRGAMEVLQRFGDDPTVRNWVQSALDRQTKQMVHLIDDLIDVSRAARGPIALHIQPVDLETIVRIAIETARPMMLHRHQKLELSLPPGPISLRVDPNRLAQVLTNLLTNAAKFTEPSGRIVLTAAREEREFVLRVSDDGMGIAANDIDHVFEGFWQSARNGGTATGGLGIGLALVRELVHAHGGTVRASSAGPGRGSEFVVRLPLDALAQSGARYVPSENGSVGNHAQKG